MSVVCQILQYFKCVPVKPESATDEQDEQLLQPNGSLYKSMLTKASYGWISRFSYTR